MTVGFRRYTNLSSLIHILETKSITLLNPATWDDKNDAYYMSEYKRLKKAKSVLALCFAEQNERYHHWRVFAPGSDGVCIEFDKEKLIDSLKTDKNFRSKKIDYKYIKNMKENEFSIDDLPFIKRRQFEDEKEFRFIYTSKEDKIEIKSYNIKINSIIKITLSPWASQALCDPIKRTLKKIDGCGKIRGLSP